MESSIFDVYSEGIPKYKNWSQRQACSQHWLLKVLSERLILKDFLPNRRATVLQIASVFDVKDAPLTGRHVVENVDKITEIIQVDRRVSNRSIVQALKNVHKTVLSRLRKVGFKKKLDVWGPHPLAPNKINRIFICEVLAKRNKINPFIQRMVSGDEKCVTCDNIV
ncbi:histone-lysine N-methyltransferase SETMAR [Trichonephila clavipes]|nr:histone-lysine N-methyltransferase SETMAR [Trichonephila clavipes]